MSYEIKITADSISELTGKLLALAAATQPDVIEGTAAVVAAEAKPKAPRGTTAAKAKANEVAEEKGNDTAGTSTTSTESANSSDAGNAATSVETPSTTGTSATDTTSADAATSSSKALDFDKDVAPVVLNAVKVHTKEWVQEVLSQFGFNRASQVPDEQLPELVAVLSAGPQ